MDMKTSPLALLKDPTLLKTDALINGQWVAGSTRLAVDDPATGAQALHAGDATAALATWTSHTVSMTLLGAEAPIEVDRLAILVPSGTV